MTDIEVLGERQDALLEEARDGSQATIPVHKIATQFYCEKQVDLAREYGDRTSPEMAAGTEAHEAATAEATEVARDEMWTRIASGEFVGYLETLFALDIGDHVTVGKPDTVYFANCQPVVLVERKTTKSPENAYPSQTMQSWLYCYMLDEMGFDTDLLRFVILTHPRSLGTETETLKRVERTAIETLGAEGSRQLQEAPPVYAHEFAYEAADRIDDLEWALEYWRAEREPVATDNAAKCRPCNHSDVCPDAKL